MKRPQMSNGFPIKSRLTESKWLMRSPKVDFGHWTDFHPCARWSKFCSRLVNVKAEKSWSTRSTCPHGERSMSEMTNDIRKNRHSAFSTAARETVKNLSANLSAFASTRPHQGKIQVWHFFLEVDIQKMRPCGLCGRTS